MYLIYEYDSNGYAFLKYGAEISCLFKVFCSNWFWKQSYQMSLGPFSFFRSRQDKTLDKKPTFPSIHNAVCFSSSNQSKWSFCVISYQCHSILVQPWCDSSLCASSSINGQPVDSNSSWLSCDVFQSLRFSDLLQVIDLKWAFAVTRKIRWRSDSIVTLERY